MSAWRRALAIVLVLLALAGCAGQAPDPVNATGKVLMFNLDLVDSMLEFGHKPLVMTISARDARGQPAAWIDSAGAEHLEPLTVPTTTTIAYRIALLPTVTAVSVLIMVSDTVPGDTVFCWFDENGVSVMRTEAEFQDRGLGYISGVCDY